MGSARPRLSVLCRWLEATRLCNSAGARRRVSHTRSAPWDSPARSSRNSASAVRPPPLPSRHSEHLAAQDRTRAHRRQRRQCAQRPPGERAAPLPTQGVTHMQITDILAQMGGLQSIARELGATLAGGRRARRPAGESSRRPVFRRWQRDAGRRRAGTGFDARPERRWQSAGRHPADGRQGDALVALRVGAHG